MPNRQIVIDTETTGLAPEEGHRIIEIGGIELIDRRFTGNDFHVYINPGRFIEQEALAVHGITSEFLADKPIFSEVCIDFLNYIKGAELIIHNAAFDVAFLNNEMRLCGKSDESISEYANIFDTLTLARKKHPGQRNNLDALCKRYNVDNSKRDLHGALLDAKLLAEVYLAMTGGQMSLFSDDNLECARDDRKKAVYNDCESKSIENLQVAKMQTYNQRNVIYASQDEVKAHRDFLQRMRENNGDGVLWMEGDDIKENE